MQTRRRMAAGAVALALLRQPARADTNQEAHDFLLRIYAQYTGQASTDGVDLSTTAGIRKLFDPPLATLILADRRQSEQNDQPPELDGDPFVDAQDWDITHLRIAVRHTDPGSAEATVQFDNLGKPVRIDIALVHLANGWRVHEIDYGTTTLSAILSPR